MRKRPRPDQIAAILRQVQADLQAGLNINQACRKGGIGLTTYYRWKALQENPVSSEQLRISELEDEVGRLKLIFDSQNLYLLDLHQLTDRCAERFKLLCLRDDSTRTSDPSRNRFLEPDPRPSTTVVSPA